MRRELKHRLIASFLTVVFSMTTVAGFACSIGIDMGYNSHHHSHDKIHSHTAKKHHHKHEHKHNHKQSSIVKFENAAPGDDCCSNDVAKFALLDKSVANNNIYLEAPVFLLAFTTTFISPTINENGLVVNSKFQFVRRSSLLYDTDIQTAIRRFQI